MIQFSSNFLALPICNHDVTIAKTNVPNMKLHFYNLFLTGPIIFLIIIWCNNLNFFVNMY